jgi:hypothetical protein
MSAVLAITVIKLDPGIGIHCFRRVWNKFSESWDFSRWLDIRCDSSASESCWKDSEAEAEAMQKENIQKERTRTTS